MELEILEVLKTITERFDTLEEKVDKLEEGQKRIVDRLENLENGQREIKAKSDDMARELSNIAGRVSGIDAITANNVHKLADLDMELTRVKAMC